MDNQQKEFDLASDEYRQKQNIVNNNQCSKEYCYHSNNVDRIKCFVNKNNIDFEDGLKKSTDHIQNFYKAYSFGKTFLWTIGLAIVAFIIFIILLTVKNSSTYKIGDDNEKYQNYIKVLNDISIAFLVIFCLIAIITLVYSYLYLFSISILREKTDYIEACFILSIIGVVFIIPTVVSIVLYMVHFNKTIKQLSGQFV